MRWVALVVVALAVVAPMSAAALPAAGPGGLAQADDANGTANGTGNGTAETAPGAQLAGVVGSQGARIDGEVETRSFAVRLERSNSTDAKAATVASAVRDTNATIDDLQTRLDELRAARDAGNVTESTYRARVAIVAQRIETVRELSNQSANAAADLPEAALRERGVSRAAAAEANERATELGGPEVAAIARNVTGDERRNARGPPANVPAEETNERPGPQNATSPSPNDTGRPDTADSMNDSRVAESDGEAANGTTSSGHDERTTSDSSGENRPASDASEPRGDTRGTSGGTETESGTDADAPFGDSTGNRTADDRST